MVKKQKEKPPEIFGTDTVLETWRTLLQAMPYMTEDECLAALKEETRRPKDERRMDIISRLHARYTKLRQKRELQELMA